MLGAAAFEGEWLVARRIEDRAGGPEGGFEGEAWFRPEGEGVLRHVEEGVLRLGTGRFVARRVYLWRFGAEEVEVAFEDGRPFHRFRPDGAVAGSDHPCGADLYRVRYDFGGWPDWSAVWEVSGPRKDYRLESRYRRR